jgi:hypothetical protein
MSPEGREPRLGEGLRRLTGSANTDCMRRVLVLALVASLSTAVAAVAATRPATLATFTRYGWGHDRGMSINRWGRGYAQINSGAGCPCFGVAFQLSHVEGTTENATATETVVRLYGAIHRHVYPIPSPLPRIGQRAVLRLHNGVVDEVFTGDDYCGPGAKATSGAGAVIGPCGA